MRRGVLAHTREAVKVVGMDTLTAPPRRARRPQAERSADTRAKLIDAAIACLNRLGYGATTVTVVAEAAGVSRGAMTHQFPAKTDLMLAVVDAVFQKDSEHYNQTVRAMDPVEWMHALPSTMWEVISQPSGIAVMEIMLASRSDPDLATKLRAMQNRINGQASEWVEERHAAAGIPERADGKAVHKLMVAAVRGLALEAVFMDNRADIEQSLAVLAEALTSLYPTLKE